MKIDRQKVKHWLKEIAITAVMILVIANLLSYLRSPNLKENTLAPINAVLTDKSVFSSQETNRPLLVHFWATWCPTCKLEASNIQTLSEHYEVVTVAIKSGSDVKLNDYLKEHALTFRVINDEEGLLAQEFSISAFPTTFIYNKDNKLAFSEVGYTSTWGLWLRMWWAGL